MRFAYADPPYLGCAHLYPEHPESVRWDNPLNHATEMARLDIDYDGWAFSLSVPSLRILLPLAPEGTRVAAWVKPFVQFNNARPQHAWEPVLFKVGRRASVRGRDWLSANSGSLQRGLIGSKPPEFCGWILDILGWEPGDEMEDLFPGAGTMGEVVRCRAGIFGPSTLFADVEATDA